MKRIYLFVALLAGGAAAFYYFIEKGVAPNVSDLWGTIQSWFTRGQLFVTEQTAPSGYSKALSMIAGFEGFSASAYPDADGYSIGYGHFITASDPYDSSSTITEADAYALLTQDAQSAANCVASAVTVPLTDNQTAALISFTYNEGCGAFKGSTMLNKLNAGDYAGAAAEFPRWNVSQGQTDAVLVSRRASEAEVFNS